MNPNWPKGSQNDTLLVLLGPMETYSTHLQCLLGVVEQSLEAGTARVGLQDHKHTKTCSDLESMSCVSSCVCLRKVLLVIVSKCWFCLYSGMTATLHLNSVNHHSLNLHLTSLITPQTSPNFPVTPQTSPSPPKLPLSLPNFPHNSPNFPFNPQTSLITPKPPSSLPPTLPSLPKLPL